MADLNVVDQLKIANTNGFFALGGVVFGALISIIKDILLRNKELKIEKIRLHDKDRIEAYKDVLVFSKKITNTCFPLAVDKENSKKYPLLF